MPGVLDFSMVVIYQYWKLGIGYKVSIYMSQNVECVAIQVIAMHNYKILVTL